MAGAGEQGGRKRGEEEHHPFLEEPTDEMGGPPVPSLSLLHTHTHTHVTHTLTLTKV